MSELIEEFIDKIYSIIDGYYADQIPALVAPIKAEIERLEEHKEHCFDRMRTMAARIAELEAALIVAREAIAQAPNDAFGSVPPAHNHPGYWIRDELVNNITKALAAKEKP